MFQTFREYLETLGIIIPKDDVELSPEDKFIEQTNTEYSKFKEAVTKNEDFSDVVFVDDYEPYIDNYENIDGDFTGVTYPLTDSGYIRFNAKTLDEPLYSLNVFITGNDQPIAEIILDGADITTVVNDIITLLKTDSYNDVYAEKDFEVENDNIRRYLPYETVESITEEGISYNKNFNFGDNAGSYNVHDIKSNTKKGMVEELWNIGRSQKEIIEITNFSNSIVKNTLKSIGAIKTIDIRPGKVERKK